MPDDSRTISNGVIIEEAGLLDGDDIEVVPTRTSSGVEPIIPTSTVKPQSDTGSNIFTSTPTTTSVVSTRRPQLDTGTNSVTPSGTPGPLDKPRRPSNDWVPGLIEILRKESDSGLQQLKILIE